MSARAVLFWALAGGAMTGVLAFGAALLVFGAEETALARVTGVAGLVAGFALGALHAVVRRIRMRSE